MSEALDLNSGSINTKLLEDFAES